jgi:hypothetical protein
MLATWLLENFLGKLNQLEDAAMSESDTELVESFKLEQSILNEDIEDFLKTYKDNLDQSTVYHLTSSYGRVEVLLKFALLVNDYGRVLDHYIDEENWKGALDTLNRQSDLELYYRHATVLVQNAPQAFIDCLLRRPELDIRRLLPALLFPSSPEALSSISSYLSHSILKLHNKDALIHNALLSILAKDDAEDGLLNFLSGVPDDPDTLRPFYDLDYALRLCQTYKRTRSSIQICSKMGMWESAVEQALKLGDIEAAKANADGPDEEEIFLRKRLWLQIAKHVIGETHDLKKCVFICAPVSTYMKPERWNSSRLQI